MDQRVHLMVLIVKTGNMGYFSLTHQTLMNLINELNTQKGIGKGLRSELNGRNHQIPLSQGRNRLYFRGLPARSQITRRNTKTSKERYKQLVINNERTIKY